MRPIVISLAMAILFLSCSNEQPISPVNQVLPVPDLQVTFGQELATVTDQAIHFEAYPFQDSISFPFWGELENVALKITENNVRRDLIPAPKSQFKLRLTTSHDQEDLQGGANLFIRGMAWDNADTLTHFAFTPIIPAKLSTQVIAGNDTLEFRGGEDDFLIVAYESPYSHKSIIDTLVIKKSI